MRHAAGCGGDEPSLVLGRRWTYTADVALAPPGVGVGDRVVVATRAAPGDLRTLEAADGRAVEGPFATLPTDHAPIMVGTDIYLVAQVSGRLVRLDLAGQPLPVTSLSLGATGPLAAAPDGSLRVAANRGALTILPGPEGTPIEAPLPGVADTAPAIDASGVTFVATDVGRVLGIDALGATTFDVQVDAPASGPSVSAARVAVGSLTGVHVFDRGGQPVFTRPRGARVVGTRILADGDVLAWGEDGQLERLGPDGAVRFSLALGPPIHAPVVVLPSLHFVVIDDDATASLVSPEGVIVDQDVVAPDERGPPLRELAEGEGGAVFLTRGKTVTALSFDQRR